MCSEFEIICTFHMFKLESWGSEARLARSNDGAGGEEVGFLRDTTVNGTNPKQPPNMYENL